MRKGTLQAFILLACAFSRNAISDSELFVSFNEGYVAVIERNDDISQRIDLRRYSGGGDIGSIVATSKNLVYVLNGDGSVSVIDGDAMDGDGIKAIDNIQEVNISNMGDIAANFNGRRIYVADFNGRSMSVIDAENNTILERVDIGGSPLGIAVDPYGRTIYTANDDYSISVIDAQTNRLKKVIKVDVPLQSIIVNQNNKYVYALNKERGLIYVMETKKHKIIKKIKITSRISKSISGYPTDMAVSRDGKNLYISSSSGSDMMFILNTTTMKIKRISDPYKASYEHIAISIDELYLIGSDNSLTRINRKNGKIISRARIDSGANGIAI